MKKSKLQQQTRRDLIGAAVALMTEQGYEATTMKQIAHAAGVGDATVYKYFPTKEKILLEFFELSIADVLAGLADTPSFDQLTLQERLQLLVDTILEGLLPDREFVAIVRSMAKAQRRFEQDLGRILFWALNQLKGTALKLAQLLSAHAEFLPDAGRAELAKGCYQVTLINRSLLYKIFRAKFGQAPEQMFAHFDSMALAAASLGQVHDARLPDGSAVAVKVQYPEIAASISLLPLAHIPSRALSQISVFNS